MRVEFRVLGTIDLRAIGDGHAQPLDLPPKIRALLAYLVLERPHRLHARDTLTALFWPELDEEHARSNLRRALYVLRGQIGPEALITRGQEEVGLDRERFWCDAVAFDELLEEDLEGALRLYRGELLPAVHLDGSAEFERWLETERTRLRDRALAALGEVASRAESAGRLVEAVRWQRKGLEIDPYDEGSLRQLMVLRARLGDRAGAIQAYEAFERRLKEDLELEPDEETRALAEAVRGGKIAVEKRTVFPTGTPSRARTPHPAPAAGEVAVSGIETEPSRDRRRVPGAAVAILPAVAVAIGLLLVLTGGEDSSIPAPDEAVASAAAPGIAVVPFRVTDPSLELWREGMVDLLSTNLDGVAGLRAINSRTVMALWREASPADDALDLARTLEVARRAGGTYAVLGSAVALGPDIRLMADVYELEDLGSLGQAQVEGSADSVFALVDRLSVGILRSIAGERGEVPPPRLASVTTASLPALKAFLEGERLYRRGDSDGAIDAYLRAVAADSTFALAYFRLSQAGGWLPLGRQLAVDQLVRKAIEHRENLSERDAHLLDASYATSMDRPRLALDILKRAVRKYPDDPEAWYQLGELYFHHNVSLLATHDDAEAAFERAVALDPRMPAYWGHLVDKSFMDADSAEAASRIAAVRRVNLNQSAPYDDFAFTVAFGDTVSYRLALAGIDTMSDDALADARSLLGHHPGTFAAQVAIVREELSRHHGQDAVWVAHLVALFLIRQGKTNAALEQLADPRVPSWIRLWDLYYMSIQKMEPPTELLETAFGSLDDPEALTRESFWEDYRVPLFLKAAYAADLGRWPRHASILQRFRHFAQEYASGDVPADSARARILQGTARALGGYALWRQGHPEQAFPLLEAAQRAMIHEHRVLRWWLAYLLLDLNRRAEALRYFESLRDSESDPFAAFEAARIHDQLGDKAAALEAYTYALAAWDDVDPVVRPRAEAARAAVRRLSGAAD